MCAWVHNQAINRNLILNFNIHSLNVDGYICIYCGNRMVHKRIEDIWKHSPLDYITAHESTLEYKWYVKEKEIPLSDLELEDGDPGNDVYCSSSICDVCGWWVLNKEVICNAKSSQIWAINFASMGILKILDLTDISVPITEVRKYIAANYEHRFSVHPKKYEELVASVFRDLGYKTKVTAYTNDGGIDILLSGVNDELIGVQVKRYKNKITAEQIRSFIGALVVKGHTKGIFITTSVFQKGAISLAKNSGEKYVGVELMDANRFFDALGIAQRNSLSKDYPFDYLSHVPVMHPYFSVHLNSL